MNKFLTAGVGALLWATLCAAVAGDDTVSETRAVDARVTRVKLDGVVDLKLKWGSAPSLTIIGERRLVDKTSTVQHGDTLNIDTETRGMKLHKGNLRAELVLPHLRELSSEGVGTTDIAGFKGDELDLLLDGAGSMKVDCSYKWLKANLGGLGGLDAKQFQVDSVNLELSGLGNATVSASQSAKLNLSGLGSVTVYGKPQIRNVSVDGLGHVSWK